jgi:pyrroline-5-carboxylate reductase
MNTAQPLAQIEGTIVLAGAGKMGGAMLAGWLARGLDASKVVVIEPHPSDEIRAVAAQGARLNPAHDTVRHVAALVIALKPQMFRDAGPGLRPYVQSSTLVVSIMAGTTIASLKEICGGCVVRAMPNTPAAIGRGITVAVAEPAVTAAQRAIADALLRATGVVEWAGDETRAGVDAGLPAELAAKLARETVAGAGELLHRSDLDPAVLRQNVSSPGGTTVAALEVLMGTDGMQALLTRAVAAATKRSRELAK